MRAALSANVERSVSTTAPVLRIAGVRKVFDKLEAIRNVTFDLADGEFVSLLGPSGCGKSTLVQIVGGLEAATSGSIHIQEPGKGDTRRRRTDIQSRPLSLGEAELP